MKRTNQRAAMCSVFSLDRVGREHENVNLLDINN